jgi:YVTN family beta-propeller protein
MGSSRKRCAALALALAAGCAAPKHSSVPGLPLTKVSDVQLPGSANRFDYQEIDSAEQHLVVAHMNAGEVLILNLADGSVAARLTGIPTARGVAIGGGRIYVTSSPNHVVLIDAQALTVISTVTSGSSPDGIAFDPEHSIVGVSDQGDGAISLIEGSGDGARTAIALGTETGNVTYDLSRHVFWITVVRPLGGQLTSVDPTTKQVVQSIDLPGCSGAHGLRIHPDGQSALIACEDNDKVARVDLGGSHAITISDSGSGPDVLSIDPGLKWLYVAAESGDLKVFDIGKSGLDTIDSEHPGDNSHTVAVDPATHRVFFPLQGGPSLRIMKPSGL